MSEPLQFVISAWRGHLVDIASVNNFPVYDARCRERVHALIEAGRYKSACLEAGSIRDDVLRAEMLQECEQWLRT